MSSILPRTEVAESLVCGLERSAFSAASRKRSFQSSTSEPLRPCFRGASAIEVPPFTMLRTGAARRLDVQRCRFAGIPSAIDPASPCHFQHGLTGGFRFEGSRIGWAAERLLGATMVLYITTAHVDVGRDTGTPVDDADDQVPFPFTGKIAKPTVKLGPNQI